MRQKRKLIQQRKLQTTNLTNDRKVKMDINKQKVLHFVLTLETEGQYFNYILMIINPNILAIL